MKFEEQKDATKRVRWGAYEEEDDKDNVYLVKKGTDLIGKIKSIEMLSLTTPTGDKTEKPNVVLEINGGDMVRFIPPAMLLTELGMNPTFMKERCASVGDIVKINYIGKKKNANLHLFAVAFGVE